MRVRITGEGEPSPNGGPPGDCYCFITVLAHPLFERDGQHLICRVPITYSQAALGTTLEVPTLDGRGELEVPAGTQSGEVFRLGGQGMPDPRRRGLGDLLVQVVIEVPKKAQQGRRDAAPRAGRARAQARRPGTQRASSRSSKNTSRPKKNRRRLNRIVSYMANRTRTQPSTTSSRSRRSDAGRAINAPMLRTRLAGTAAEAGGANDRLLRCRPRWRTSATARRAKSPTSASTRRCRAARPAAGARQHQPRDRSGREGGRSENLLEGFRLVRQQLVTTLANHGASRSRLSASRSIPISTRRSCSSRRATPRRTP